MTTSTSLSSKEAIWATQGGGYARFDRKANEYVFTEAPPAGLGLKVGDPVPEEWDLQPANETARVQMADF